MAQESWKLEKDETDCELLKPPSSAGASSSASPTPVPPLVCAKSPSQDLAHQKLPKRSESPTPAAESIDPESSCRRTPKEELSKPVRFTNRCSSCQRRVGLTGFRCRCGSLFCGTHRYSDTHDCSFDYKAVGREEIAKANPLIRAAKIIKI